MNRAAPESDTHVSLSRWLAHPASWSVLEILALLILVCIGGAVLMVGENSLMADLLAVAAYGALALLILLLAWRRYSKND